MAFCLKVLAERSPFLIDIFNHQCRVALSEMLAVKCDEEEQIHLAKLKKGMSIQADDPIAFSQLASKTGLCGTEVSPFKPLVCDATYVS